MNVLIASHLFPNRQEPLKGVFVLEIARALARHVSVEVLAPLPAFPWLRPYRDVPSEDIHSGIRTFHPRYLALPSALFGWRWRTYHRATRRVMELGKLRPDVVHVHWLYPDAYAVIRWARERGIKVVVTVHGHAAFGWFGSKALWPYYRKALCEADHVIAVSREIREKVVRDFGVEETRVTVIHNGVDLARFPLATRELARRRLGLPLNKRILLAVARLSPEKGLHRLITAANQCGDSHDWQLHIVGAGPLEFDLREQIAGLGLESRVLLEGGIPHEQLHDWYGAADVFCLSSLHEGCPVVVHEALACGVPVVSTSVGAVPDFLNSKDVGLLCDVGREDDLHTQIELALQASWDRARIAEYGRTQTWDSVAEQTIRVYDLVIGKGRK